MLLCELLLKAGKLTGPALWVLSVIVWSIVKHKTYSHITSPLIYCWTLWSPVTATSSDLLFGKYKGLCQHFWLSCSCLYRKVQAVWSIVQQGVSQRHILYQGLTLQIWSINNYIPNMKTFYLETGFQLHFTCWKCMWCLFPHLTLNLLYFYTFL